MEREDIIYIFKNYYRYKELRERIQDQIVDFEARATKVTPNFDPENVGGAPITNPKPSKVELYSVKLVEAQERVKELDTLIDTADKLLGALWPRQRYLIQCVVCNSMSYEQFAKKAKITPATVKANLEKIYKKLETIE